MKFNKGQQIIDIIRGKNVKKIINELVGKNAPKKMTYLEYANILFEISSHKCSKKEYQSDFAFAPDITSKQDFVILDRLKKLYLANQEVFAPSKLGDIWQIHFVPHYQALFENLKNNNDTEALNFLNNICRNKAVFGFLSWRLEDEEDFKKDRHRSLRKKAELNYLMDPLIGIAEWLEIIPAEGFIDRSMANYIYKNPDEILDLIEAKLGFEIKFPEFQNGLLGINSKRGVFTHRHIYYLYIALKIKELCKDIKNPRICEIGGGIGFLAYYCNMIGLKDITLIDIPSVSFISSYFLMKNMPNRKFVFSDDENKYNEPNAIKILFPEYFNNSPNKQYDIVVNCDSFPEINEKVTREYLQNIKRNSELFYSINHEEHIQENISKNVPSLISYVGGFNKKFRHIFWLRKGYIESLYKVAQ